MIGTSFGRFKPKIIYYAIAEYNKSLILAMSRRRDFDLSEGCILKTKWPRATKFGSLLRIIILSVLASSRFVSVHISVIFVNTSEGALHFETKMGLSRWILHARAPNLRVMHRSWSLVSHAMVAGIFVIGRLPWRPICAQKWQIWLKNRVFGQKTERHDHMNGWQVPKWSSIFRSP